MLVSRWEADEDRALDLLQEAFVRVWRALPEFRGDSALSTWIHSIAVRTAMDRMREDSRRARREEVAGRGHSTEVADAPAARLDLERALAALPDGQRRMLILHGIEGYRCREIAERLGVAVGTVRSQVHRARRKLKEALDA